MEKGEKEVQLLKDYVDLSGYSYFGNIRKAICYETLLCAAKIIHPNLVVAGQMADGCKDMQRISTDAFLHEIEPLAAIRHPNIVLCLGMYRDPDTKLPVILMEYMDQNLTQYLEGQQQPLSYDSEFRLTCDMAQGLSFLHYSKIIHGNLSSNNVLILRGSQAKIADFGLAEIFKDTHILRHKEHPFSSLYLPLSLDATDPKFGFKIDVYAFGVLMIQVLTMKRPEPDRTAHSSNIFNLSQEKAARRNDWSLVDTDNPLLQVALKCLEDKPKKRPNFVEICEDLNSAMKKQFTKSTRVPLSDISDKVNHIKDPEDNPLSEEPSDEFVIIHTPPQETKPSLQATPIPEKALTRLEPKVKVKSKTLHKWEYQTLNCPHATSRATDAVYDNEFMYLLCGPDRRTVLRFGPLCNYQWGEHIERDNPAVWSSLEPAEFAHSSLVVIGPSLLTVGGCNKWKRPTNKFYVFQGRWKEAEYSMPTSRHSATVVYWKSFLVIAGGCGDGQKALSTVEVLDRDKDQWFIASSLPEPASSLSGCVCGEQVWVVGSNYKTTFSTTLCDLGETTEKTPMLLPSKSGPKGAWSYASIPVFDTTLVVIEDSLYAIGGKCVGSSKPTDAVYEFSHKRKEWYIVGQMKMPRSNCLAVTVPFKKIIIVAGGISESGCEINSVEVAHVRTSLDSKLSNLF